jgi:hypothetical protein
MTPAQRITLLNKVIASLAAPAGATRITPGHLNRYDWLRANLPVVDVAVDPVFQSTFSGLFKMRYMRTAHRPSYFGMMEAQKGLAGHAFPALLNAHFAASGRQEMSFISKLIHIIDPHRAIWDSELRAKLVIPDPAPRTVANCDAAYAHLENEMGAMLTHPLFQQVQMAFNARFPGRVYTPMRILDASIWGL